MERGDNSFPSEIMTPSMKQTIYSLSPGIDNVSEKFDSSKCWNFALSVTVLISLLRFPLFLHNMFNIYSFNFRTVWFFFTFSFNLSRWVFYDHGFFFFILFFSINENCTAWWWKFSKYKCSIMFCCCFFFSLIKSLTMESNVTSDQWCINDWYLRECVQSRTTCSLG